MKPAKPIFLLLAWLLLSGSGISAENRLVITADMQMAYADKLFDEQDYSTALVEYRRFLHFFKNDGRSRQARYRSGLCHFYLDRFYQAARVFNDIILADKQDKILEDAVFMQSLAFEKMKNYGYAQIVLQNYLKLTDDTTVKDRLYTRLVQIELNRMPAAGQWETGQARRYLSGISPAGRTDPAVRGYSDIIRKLDGVPKKDPKTAGLLAVIPGGGYLYCNRKKDALTAFCVNAGLIWAAWEAFDNDSPVLGTLLGLVETGFYTGNIYGSISSAHKYNLNRKLNILNREISYHPVFDPKTKEFAVRFNYEF